MIEPITDFDLDEEQPLFYLEESRYGCTQPIRCGDLARFKKLGYGWIEEGQICMVVDVCLEGLSLGESGELEWDILADPSECEVIFEGVKRRCRIQHLEAI